MATPLKDLYNDTFFDYFIQSFAEVHPAFDGKRFKREVYAGAWPSMELKERMHHTADVLAKHLPADYAQATDRLMRYVDHWHKTKRRGYGLELMFLPDFLERHGLHDVETSVVAMEKITTISSAEFAIRPFLNKYPERMMQQMYRWAEHPDEWVRRLSTEGFRPRLPWGLAVPYLKKDPSPVFRVLEMLKNDTSETVRRSVANNLNDISKDHPEMVLQVLARWKNEHPDTEKIVKHASRTLLKQGNIKVLELFGSGSSKNLEWKTDATLPARIKVGDKLPFAFSITHTGKNTQKVRLEYVIYFLLKNGTHGRKVFFIAEKELEHGQTLDIKKSHSFKPITTRTYYPGTHKVAALMNGKEFEIGEFLLEEF